MLNWLFDSTVFVSRNHCGVGWTPELVLVNSLGNCLIAIAYFTIPISLYVLWLQRKRDIPFPYVLILFMHFIFFCAMTHLNEVLVFYRPMYRYFTLMTLLTASFSIVTAFVLPYTIVKLTKLPSFGELRELNEQLSEQLEKKTKLKRECLEQNKLLKLKLAKFEQELETKSWLGTKYKALEELKLLLDTEITCD